MPTLSAFTALNQQTMMRAVLIILLCGLCQARLSTDLRVRIHDGRMIGRHLTSESGRTIRAFMGIPYALPPTGNRRFKAPEKVARWEGILQAHNEPPKCTQTNPATKKAEGQEDCLYLNVYAPKKRAVMDKVPVLVWLHGGGWFEGHGGYSLYSPDYLLEHDVVLVTGNYRLGPLGFLSTEDKECPGNFGLKDQVMMLTWVRMNIDKFGGDSNSITIFGNSAGAASVNYHMVSPMSKGLFDRAISQSGSLMNIWADAPRPGLAKMRAIRLTDKMNCPITNTNYKDMIECLRKVDAKKITEAMHEFYEWDVEPLVIFPPVVESSLDSEEAFIPSFRFNKHSLDIPWLVGLSSDEGLIKTAPYFNNKKLMNSLTKEWTRLLPIIFHYDHLYTDEQDEITESLNEFYFKNEPLSDSNRDNLTNLFTDGFFMGVLENLEFRLRNNLRDNTFVYQLSHKGFASYTELIGGGSEKFYGTCHADELLYLFPSHKTIPALFGSMPTEQDKELTRLMTKLWVNFATTGNPTPEWSTASKFPLWSSATKFPLDYLAIGNKNGNSEKLLTMERDLFPESFAFWMKLRKDSPKWGAEKFKNELDDELNDELKDEL